MGRMIRGRAVVAGRAEGVLLVSPEPLSFWGGYDPRTGEIIDQRHVCRGQSARHRVLALPATRGSSTTTAILLEAVRHGAAPTALVTRGVDDFLSLAVVVAEELYGATVPLVALDSVAFEQLVSGTRVRIDGPLLEVDPS